MTHHIAGLFIAVHLLLAPNLFSSQAGLSRRQIYASLEWTGRLEYRDFPANEPVVLPARGEGCTGPRLAEVLLHLRRRAVEDRNRVPDDRDRGCGETVHHYLGWGSAHKRDTGGSWRGVYFRHGYTLTRRTPRDEALNRSEGSIQPSAGPDAFSAGMGRAACQCLIGESHSSKVFRYSRNWPPRSSRFRANSTVAFRKPSLSPVS